MNTECSWRNLEGRRTREDDIWMRLIQDRVPWRSLVSLQTYS